MYLFHFTFLFPAPAHLQVYHRKITRPDGTQGWCGGADLASSAMFTWGFCRALLDIWAESRRPLPAPEVDEVDVISVSSDHAVEVISVSSESDDAQNDSVEEVPNAAA